MKNIEEKIFDYLEGTLSKSELEEFERLMAKDASLRMEVESIRRADGLFSENRVLHGLDDAFSDKVVMHVSRKNRFRTSNRLLWLAVSLFAFILGAAVMVLPAVQSAGAGSFVPENWVPQMPAFDGGKLMETLDNPALMQLALIINAIALLLVLDKVLSKKIDVA